jgi:predicted PurR-regulated permease PerM
MLRIGLIPRLWLFARKYLVVLLLIGCFAFAMFQVYITGTPPVPQQPPQGYTLGRLQARLQWNKGTRPGAIQLQVSVDDPDFIEPLVDKKTTGSNHSMRNLLPGHTYYWRLVQEGKPGPVASFKTSPYAIKF